MNIKDAYAQHKTLELMRNTVKDFEKTFKGLGFCLLIFPVHNPGVSNYISNAERKSMIKALRDTADRLENNQDFNREEG